MTMASGDKDTSILDSSIEAEIKSSHERAREGRPLLSDRWHMEQCAVSACIMRVLIGR